MASMPADTTARPPDHDGDQEITWRPWTDAPCVTHIDPACPSCGHPGPLLNTCGLTLYTPPPPDGGTSSPRPYLVATHWASRCPSCAETEVWRRRGWTRISHHLPLLEHVLPPADGVLF
jgi:hypothetical protein